MRKTRDSRTGGGAVVETEGLSLAPDITRLKILEASMAAFSANGVDGTRVEDLLVAAGLSRRTFYRYFRNKQDVLVAIYDLACDRLRDVVAMSLRIPGELPDQVRAGINGFFAFHHTAGPLMRVLHQEAMRSESPLAPRRKELHREVIGLLQELDLPAQDEPRDPLVYQCVIWVLEDMSLYLLTETTLQEADIDRATRVLFTVCSSLLGISD